MKKMIVLVTSLMILAGCTSSKPVTPSPTSEDTTRTTTQAEKESPTMAPLIQPTLVLLSTTSPDGQSGMSTFTDLGEGRTKVIVTLQGSNFTTTQPVDIRLGTCARPGKMKFTLGNVVNGKAETIVETPLSELSTGEMIISVHKSTQESIITACGAISTASQN